MMKNIGSTIVMFSLCFAVKYVFILKFVILSLSFLPVHFTLDLIDCHRSVMPEKMELMD